MEKTQKNNKLNAKDFIFIGIFGAVALLIFFVTGAIAALTVFDTIANIPITLFFVSIAFMLLVSKVGKTAIGNDLFQVVFDRETGQMTQLKYENAL